MAINKNHEFEELNGVKCGIVERNVKPERVVFLKELLEYNGFIVIAVPSPPPKVIAPSPKPAVTTAADSPQPAANSSQPATSGSQPAISSQQPAASSSQPAASNQLSDPPPETFTVGVTDYTFNPINAIFGRQLKTKNGHIVTLAYWEQQDTVSNDEIPYYE